MRRAIAWALGVLSISWIVGEVAAQQFDPPQIIGTLTGAVAQYPNQPHLHLYGNDLGWSFEHKGKLQILFGDTWAFNDSVCDLTPANNDDSQAVLEHPWTDRMSLPQITFETTAADPNVVLQPLEVFRDGVSLEMGLGRVATTGFSDGDNAYGVFSRASFVACDPAATPSCPEGLVCAPTVGRCTTLPGFPPALCDIGTGAGCPLFSFCDSSGPGYCVDKSSSQYDGSQNSERFAVAHEMEIGLQQVSQPTVYDSAAVFKTNKFTNMTARTVTVFTGTSSGNDYRPSATPDTLFMWGRPWFLGEQGRQAQLYLLRHDLPLVPDAGGKIKFVPEYFAGLDSSGEPLFDKNPTAAVPLALDGASDPTESRVIVDQMAVSWVGSPINKWVMLYGGDVPDFFLIDPGAVDPADRGPILIRYADHPWGPWSPAQPILSPGSPSVEGSPYGPGGVLFHNACVDSANFKCARSDPHRPLDLLTLCIPPLVETDIGRFYGPNIIDAYTELAGDHANIYWNVSTWNPYAVILLKTTLRPSTGPAPCSGGDCAGDGAGGGGIEGGNDGGGGNPVCANGECNPGQGTAGTARAGGCSIASEGYSGQGEAGTRICALAWLAALALKRKRMAAWLFFKS
jgi:hypothetical protein